MVAPTTSANSERRPRASLALAVVFIGGLLLFLDALSVPPRMPSGTGVRRRGGPQPRLAAADFFTLNES